MCDRAFGELLNIPRVPSMINANEALRVIVSNTHTLGAEKVGILESMGRTLAEDIVAPEDLPALPNSSMDGFALRSEDVRRASRNHPVALRVVGEASAGNRFRGKVVRGQAIKIMTGGVMPKGADTVVPRELTESSDGKKVEVLQSAPAGQHVRGPGEDIKKGEIVLHAGEAVGPAQLGVLAALGYTRIRAFQKPSVNILATGDELVRVHDAPGPGQIRNSTSYALAGYVLQAGGDPHLLGIVPDRRRRLQKKIEQGLQSDLLLITGGVSVGDHDHVKEVLETVGVRTLFWKVNIKPGRPMLFGRYKKTLVFGLPGNPVSTSVTFLQFVRPALLTMTGRSSPPALRMTAILDHHVQKHDGKMHFMRGILRRCDDGWHVGSAGSQSSGVMTSMTRANCLVLLPEQATGFRTGDRVEVELLSQP
jgi:molybdopterin molybdotransferase